MQAAPSSPEPAVYQLPLLSPDDNGGQHAAGDDADRMEVESAAPLFRNAVWLCHLRWGVAGLLAAAAVAGLFPEQLSEWGLRLSVAWPLAMAATLVVLNLGYRMLLPRTVEGANPAAIRANVWFQIVADLVVLSVVIHFVGSVETYAPFMYLFHIIFACVFFPRPVASAVAVGAAGLYLVVLGLESAGWIMPRTVLVHSGTLDRSQLPWQFWVWQIGSAFLIGLGIWYLASRQAGDLKRRELALAKANFRLQAGMEERSRHMLQTTHQLKAPFAAIHANAQVLLGGYCGEIPEAATEVVEKISSRCTVLSQQILDMLQLANLRSDAQASPPGKELALDEILRAEIARLEPTATRREIEFHANLEPVRVIAGEDHLHMLLDNLLSNAVNYSYDGGTVDVRCDGGDDGSARLIVRDAGIGIEPDKLPLIFQDYYRTNEASAHNKASTGLGLAIIRDVAHMWKIRVEVETAPRQGTQFTLTFPAGAGP